MTRWIVRCDHGCETYSYYGPFGDEPSAQRFAEFVTAEIDPATVHEMCDPVNEFMGYWRSLKDEESATEAGPQ